MLVTLLYSPLYRVIPAHAGIQGDQRADPGLGEKRRNPGAAGADSLGQGTLRVEFQFELAVEVELGEQPVLADIGRDHLADLPGLQEQTEPGAVDPGIVRYDGQPF